ncbi:MAG: Zn-ribbon domain-containing OB-fold protein [Halobellus sp.]|uniref:Zn-ribbon domain-containing OB-fold protein n=1 Tax=Halobellus sp. TaxID=1979212 RepID=UPI0035D4B9A2
MIWEPRPVPAVTPETAPYWEAAADETLLLRRCTACELTFYYPRARCPDCLGDDVEWTEANGTGTVYAHTSTNVAAWPEDDLPLVLAYVELTEGPRMLTTLAECDADAIEIGTDVEVSFIPTESDDVSIPVFEPTDD